MLICTYSTKCRLLVAPSKLKGIHSSLARDLKYEMHWVFCCPRQLTCSAFTIRVAVSTTQGNFAALATVTVTTMSSITLFKQILVWQVGVCDGNETRHTDGWPLENGAAKASLHASHLSFVIFIFQAAWLASPSLPNSSTPSCPSSSLLTLTFLSTVPLFCTAVTQLSCFTSSSFWFFTSTHNSICATFHPAPCV